MWQAQALDEVAAGCSGFCRRCGREHRLEAGPAQQACLELMAALETEQRIDLHLPAAQADDRFATSWLFGPARGKMFGVMVAKDGDGRIRTLRAFSGQYCGVWQVPGWVGPVFDLAAFHRVHDAEEREIKALGKKIAEQEHGSPEREQLIAARKMKSRRLMADIHALYRLRNFSGQVAGLQDVFPAGMGIPTGTGDCCAPKLLQHAVENGLVPLGMAEFYWGRENASASRQHGRLYSSCRTKCYPILGFMLCGLEKSWR